MRLHEWNTVVLVLISICLSINTNGQSIVDDIMKELEGMEFDTVEINFYRIGELKSNDNKKMLVKIIHRKKPFLDSYCVFNRETNSLVHLRNLKYSAGTTNIISAIFYDDKVVLIYRELLYKEGIQVFDYRGQLKFLFEGIIPGEQLINTRLDRANSMLIIVTEEIDKEINNEFGLVYVLWKFNLRTNRLIDIAKVRKSTIQIEFNRQIKNLPIITLDIERKLIKLKKHKEKTEAFYQKRPEDYTYFTQIHPIGKHEETKDELIFEY